MAMFHFDLDKVVPPDGIDTDQLIGDSQIHHTGRVVSGANHFVAVNDDFDHHGDFNLFVSFTVDDVGDVEVKESNGDWDGLGEAVQS